MTTLNAELVKNVPDLPYLLSIVDDPLKLAEREKIMQKVGASIKPYDFGDGTYTIEEITYPGADGYQLTSHFYRPSTVDNADQRVILYIHGGGMMYGSVTEYDSVAGSLALLTQLPVFSLDYRLAPNNSQPDDLVNDVYAGVKWAVAHANDLEIDPKRLILWGQSAGGGLAAGVVPLAHADGLAVYRVVLIYPMLDDATVVEQHSLP